MRRLIALTVALLFLAGVLPIASVVQAAPAISNINMAVTCNTSALINFRTNIPAHAYIEYGTTTGYGSSTIDDTVRYYREHAIQLTSLSSNTLYHYRIRATNSGETLSDDQTFTTATAGTSCQALPAQVDSRMPDMSGATEYLVKADCTGFSDCYTNFQTALTTAGTDNGKRYITVDAGLTLTGNFTFPANADGNWIIIRSSSHASLPEGKRVTSADASLLFKLQANTLDPTIVTAAASNHIRLIGAEVTIDPTTAGLGTDSANNPQTSTISYQTNNAGAEANLAKFIGIDRCWVHGLVDKHTIRGVYATGEDLFFIDSTFDNYHSSAYDSQAILFTAVKRAKILNNTIIASGECFMWGGTGIGITGYAVGGLEYERNHMYFPLAWKTNGAAYGGHSWAEKNLFELKTSAKALIFGNYFGGTSDSQGGQWPDAQAMAINFKLEQDSTGPGTCDLMEDIVFYKNFVKNVANGIANVGRTVGAQGCTNNPQRVLIAHNVVEVDFTTWSPEPSCTECGNNATGYFASGTYYLQIIHNTMINANPTQGGTCSNVYTDGMMMLVGDTPSVLTDGFVYKDNIADFRGCGVAGGFVNGTDATASLNNVYNTWTFTNNGIMRSAGSCCNFPTGQVWNTSWSPQLVNFNSGLDGNYRVAASSDWHNAATDGTDLGADIEGAELASQYSPTGDWLLTGSDPGSSSPRVKLIAISMAIIVTFSLIGWFHMMALNGLRRERILPPVASRYYSVTGPDRRALRGEPVGFIPKLRLRDYIRRKR